MQHFIYADDFILMKDKTELAALHWLWVGVDGRV